MVRLLNARLAWLLACVTTAWVLSSPGAAQAPGAATATGIWDGIYTEAQADRGRRAFAQHCATCHGADLKGGSYRALSGDRFWASFQEVTVDRLLRQISTTMPFSGDGSLKGTLDAAVYADIMAYILSGNGFPAGARELSADTVAGVRIVRKDGSRELPAGSFAQIVGCLAPGNGRGQWTVLRASPPARVTSTDAVDGSTPLGSREYGLRFVITPLDRYAGHRVAVRGTLLGPDGAEGINVTSVASIATTCE